MEVELFGRPTYLADSMQFQLEYLTRLHRRGVYYIMPTFRGEAADERHLNEFFHVEAEFEGDLDAVIHVVEGLLIALMDAVIRNCAEAILPFTNSVRHVEQIASQGRAGFSRIAFPDAVARLGNDELSFKRIGAEIIGLTHHGEQRLLREVAEPLWLTHLPQLGVPFYQADFDERHSKCADLLLGPGEVVGCGERHHHLPETEAAMALRRVDPTPYAWYLRLKREHPIRTAGFGLGLERLLLAILQHDDIRDVQIFVRQRQFFGVP